MGLAASQARLLMLTARKSDLELQLQFNNQARLQLSNIMNTMFNQSQNLDPNGPDGQPNPQVQQINLRIAQVQNLDKRLELDGRRIDTQHQAVQTEVDAVSKVISKNIESSFKLMG